MASDDIDVFETVRFAERYLEPPDVVDRLQVFDRDGHPVKAVVENQKRLFVFSNEVVRLQEMPDAVPRPDALREHLVQFISVRHIVDRASAEMMTLGDLWKSIPSDYYTR
jgi:hypothetical protein